MIVIALFGCVNWSFTLISVHLGMHWSMVTGIMGKDGKKFVTRTIFLRIVAIVIAGYGLYAFFIRKIEKSDSFGYKFNEKNSHLKLLTGNKSKHILTS